MEAPEWIKHIPLKLPLWQLEYFYIAHTLYAHGGNRTYAAKALGISLRSLRDRIKRIEYVGIDLPPAKTGKH